MPPLALLVPADREVGLRVRHAQKVLRIVGAERLLVAPMTTAVFVAAVAAWRFCNESATLLSGGIAGSFGLLFGIGLVRARRRWINLVHDEVPDRFQSENGFDVR